MTKNVKQEPGEFEMRVLFQMSANDSAVLIDSRGVPRARCFCGNPLLPPRLATAAAAYTGPTWTGFDPRRVVVVPRTRFFS